MGTRAAIFWTAWAAIAFWAEAGSAAEMSSVERGNAHYLLFCANCHGVNADGKGPLVDLLKVTPSDLTLLRQTGGGVSVSERVVNAVAGRHEVASGERKMPIFNENLEIKTVVEIADFLETIQK